MLQTSFHIVEQKVLMKNENKQWMLSNNLHIVEGKLLHRYCSISKRTSHFTRSILTPLERRLRDK